MAPGTGGVCLARIAHRRVELVEGARCQAALEEVRYTKEMGVGFLYRLQDKPTGSNAVKRIFSTFDFFIVFWQDVLAASKNSSFSPDPAPVNSRDRPRDPN